MKKIAGIFLVLLGLLIWMSPKQSEKISTGTTAKVAVSEETVEPQRVEPAAVQQPMAVISFSSVELDTTTFATNRPNMASVSNNKTN